MPTIHRIETGIPTRTRWLLGLLAAVSGVLTTTIGFGLGSSAVASAKLDTAHRTFTTTAATRAETKSYSGGRLMAADPSGGYWTVSWLGVIASYGGAPTFGSPSLSGIHLAEPIVGMAATPDGQGYWLVASDGGIFAYGDANFYGSTGAIHLNKPIVGMAATPDGQGYWLVASDGGIFTYGDATFYGSAGAVHLNQPIVGMAGTPDGQGYWLVASDGGIFTYGDAKFYGSTGAIHLNEPIAGMAATPDGKGYWLVASDGGIFTYGDANFRGTLGVSGKTAIGMIVSPATSSYTLVELGGISVVPTLAPSESATAPSASGVSSTAEPSGQAPPGPDALAGYTQSYVSDFTGTTLPAGWGAYSGKPGGDPGAQWGLAHAVVSNGMLQLEAYQDSAYGGEWVTGGVSQSGRSQTYGAYYVRSRVTGAGPTNVELLWPVAPVWPPEIDFNETGGAAVGTSATVHWGPGNNQDQRADHTIDMTQWHTWGVIWTPTSITYTVDGQVWGTVTVASEIPNQPMVLDLQQQTWCSSGFACPTTPVSMDIDWVAEYSPS
jgi:hypothetical protein